MRRFLPDVSGWSRAVALSGLLLIACAGLCGLNFAAVTVFNVSMDGAVAGAAHPKLQSVLSGVIMVTGTFETAGMVLGAAGLVVSMLGWIASAVVHHFQDPKNGE